MGRVWYWKLENHVWADETESPCYRRAGSELACLLACILYSVWALGPGNICQTQEDIEGQVPFHLSFHNKVGSYLSMKQVYI